MDIDIAITMNNPVVLNLIFTAARVIMLLHLVLFSASLSPSDQDLLYEEKARLGSRPPSCHNKCIKCHPCMAIQVPTLPKNDPKVRSGLTRKIPTVYIEPSPQTNSYSNYKPLGWKCHCRDHLFNP